MQAAKARATPEQAGNGPGRRCGTAKPSRWTPRDDTTRAALRAEAPVPGEGSTDLVAGRVGDDEFGLRVTAVKNAVLPKSTPKVQRLVAFDAVHQPGGFPPDPLRLLIVTDAVL